MGDQLLDAGGRDRDAVLVVLDLARDPDLHDAAPPRRPGGPASGPIASGPASIGRRGHHEGPPHRIAAPDRTMETCLYDDDANSKDDAGGRIRRGPRCPRCRFPTA